MLFDSEFFDEVSESITIKSIDRGGANVWGSSETDVATVDAIVIRSESGARYADGADDVSGDAYTVYITPVNNSIKHSMKVHRQDSQRSSGNAVLHIVSTGQINDYTILRCRNDENPQGQSG